MQRIMSEGGLIPYQLTVQILINAMIANPSKSYLIDGFPRARDQAIYFEQVVGEAHTILYFNTPLQICVDRCMERAKTSGRADDTEEVIKARLETFQNQSYPVVEMYKAFGKVKEVDGQYDVMDVWNATRKAILPQVSWIMGPTISGKATLGAELAKRTNAKLLRFSDFLKEHGLEKSNDDTVVLALIHQLTMETQPRVLIADFPKNIYQAKLFIKNSVAPSRVFVLNCSKDVCQERMIEIPQSSSRYVPSALLTRRICDYNNNLRDLIDFLRNDTDLTEVSTEIGLRQSMDEICKVVEPTVINVRSSGSDEAEAVRNEINAQLQEQGYKLLCIEDLVEQEVQRGTDIGCRIKNDRDAGKSMTECAGSVVEVLKKVIYSGIDEDNKFLLADWPNDVAESDAFEAQCCKIGAIIYATPKGPTVEVRGDDLACKNIDTVFAKNFRLKTMNEWDDAVFENHLGKNVQWGMFTGRHYSGKKTAAATLATQIRAKVVNFAAIRDQIKKEKGTDDEPFEGDISTREVEDALLQQIQDDQDAGHKYTYLFE